MNYRMTKTALLAMINIDRNFSVSKSIPLSVSMYFPMPMPLNSCDFFRDCDLIFLWWTAGKAASSFAT